MTIDAILELMDELIDKSVAVPFSNKKCLVEGEKMREYIDEIRYGLPNEIKTAKEMVLDRTQIISEAKAEAEKIIKRAEERAKLLTSNDEIVKQAKERATEILSNAQTKERGIRNAMNDRMEEMLGEAEDILGKNIADIRQIRTAIRSSGKKK